MDREHEMILADAIQEAIKAEKEALIYKIISIVLAGLIVVSGIVNG